MSSDAPTPDVAPPCSVTGQPENLGPLRHCICGVWFRPAKWNQESCSPRCSDRRYNQSRPVVRLGSPTQRTLPLTPGPLRVHVPPHNPALVHKLKPATLHVLGLLGDGQPHSRHELYRVGGTRYSARVEELRAAGHRVLGPSKSLRWEIYECEPAGPGGLEHYRLEGANGAHAVSDRG